MVFSANPSESLNSLDVSDDDDDNNSSIKLSANPYVESQLKNTYTKADKKIKDIYIYIYRLASSTYNHYS